MARKDWSRPMLCQDCPDRNSCLKLCPEAEVYVDQDAPIVHLPDDFHLTKMEVQIVRFFMQGKTRSAIAEMLNISRDALDKHISRMKKKSDLIDL